MLDRSTGQGSEAVLSRPDGDSRGGDYDLVASGVLHVVTVVLVGATQARFAQKDVADEGPAMRLTAIRSTHHRVPC